MKKMIVMAFSCAAAIICVTSSHGETSQCPPGKYCGDKKSFITFKDNHSKNDWPIPDTIDYYDPENNGAKAIRYAHWTPPSEKRIGVVVHFNGRTEFIEKNIYTYKDLLERGFEIWSFDWRGQGLSQRQLITEKQKHDIDTFDTYVNDANYLIDKIAHIKEAKGKKVLLAHSMGGQIALRYLLDHPNVFDYAVLSSPLLRIRGDGHNLRIENWFKNNFFMETRCVGSQFDAARNIPGLYHSPVWLSYFKKGDSCDLMASANIDETALDPDTNAKSYSNDLKKNAEIDCLIESSKNEREDEPDLRLACPTSRWLHAAFESTDIVMDNAKKLKTPTLIVRALPDMAVDNAGQTEFCKQAENNCKIYDIKKVDDVQTGHELLIEKEPIRKVFFDFFDGFVGINSGANISTEMRDDRSHGTPVSANSPVQQKR